MSSATIETTASPSPELEGTPKPRLTTSSGILFQADCFDLLAGIRDDAVHCVFADPPFNLSKDYQNGFEDEWDSNRHYLRWCMRWIDECCRVLSPGGALFIYSIPRWAYHFAAHLDGPLEFRHWIAMTMKGTFPRGNRLYPAHYALLYFTKGTPQTFNKIRTPIPTCRHCGGDIKDYGGHRKKLHPEGLNLTDFWEDTSPNRHRRSKARHGVNELKSIIPSRAIEIATKERDIVLDPFGGGGSTYQEAQRLGRYWIGSEIGDCEPIESRMRDFAATTVGRQPPASLFEIFKP